MKASVDREPCLGCGLCIEVCPEVFEMDDDSRAQAKMNQVPPESEGTCRDAAEQCPESAIKIEED